MTADEAPSFPPLLKGEKTLPGIDPFAKAVAAAALGTDPGLVCWTRDETALRAALVLAPEAPLERAVGIVFAVALGLGDALGALAPPEVAVHYVWPGGFKVNGADCGAMRAAASTSEPASVPDWLVIGVEMPYLHPASGDEPGRRPDQLSSSFKGVTSMQPSSLRLVWSGRWPGSSLDPGLEGGR